MNPPPAYRVVAAARAPAPEPRTTDQFVYWALMERLFPSRPRLKIETAINGYNPHDW